MPLPQPSDSSFCSCGFGSLGEQTVTVPPMPAGTKDLCLTDLCLPSSEAIWDYFLRFNSVLRDSFTCLGHLPRVPGPETLTGDVFLPPRSLPLRRMETQPTPNPGPLLSVCLLFWDLNLRLDAITVYQHVLIANCARWWFLFSVDLLSKICDT